MPTQNCVPLPSAAPNAEIQGVLWDMDGTLLDTEPYWMAAEAALVAEFGGRWSQDQAMALVGNALPDAAAAHAGLVAAGVEVRSEPIELDEPGYWHGAKVFYSTDPDGVTVELIERP